MAVLPKFNIRPLIDELLRTDIKSFVRNARNESVILKEWNTLIAMLKSVSGKLASGEHIAECELLVIKNSASCLATSAAEFGSMIPGPIGILCSVALAIGCLIPPVDIVAFVLNILGAIPFAKAGTKAFKPILNNIISDFLNNPAFKNTLREGAYAGKKAKYNEEIARKMFDKLFRQNNSNLSNAKHLDIGSSNPFNNTNSIMNKPLGSDKYIQNTPISTNKMLYILSTKTGKNDPYSHLYPRSY